MSQEYAELGKKEQIEKRDCGTVHTEQRNTI